MHTREYLALNPQGYGLLLLTLSRKDGCVDKANSEEVGKGNGEAG